MANERYNRICEIVQSGWIIGCPVELNKGALLIDNVSKQVILQVSLRNVSEAVIKQVDLLIHRFDLAGDPVSDSELVVKYSLADRTEQPRALFGEKSAILLGANSTRQVKIIFKRVILADGTVWRNENDSTGDPYPLQALSSVLSSELVVQFNREYDARYPVSRQTAGNRVHSYVPIFADRVWVCTCGFPNDNTTAKCGRCQVEKEWLQNATHEPYLAGQLSAYLAEQARRKKIEQEEYEERARRMKAEEAERLRTQKEKDEKLKILLAQENAKRLKIRKRNLIIATIITVLVAVSIAGYNLTTNVIIPEQKYNAAKDLLAGGKYADAITAFGALGDYKDSPEMLQESHYLAAQELLAGGKYADAITAFGALGDYKDSTLIIEQYKYQIQPQSKSGDIVKIGHYEQDNDPANGKETITWKVLAIENGKALLISEMILDCQPYHTKQQSVTWETCSMRHWLNTTFINEAFTADEQTRIMETELANNDNSVFGTNGGNTTRDKVFLLSIAEATQYFANDAARVASNTLNIVSVSGVKDWWLRSPGSLDNRAAFVGNDGHIYEFGFIVIGRDVDYSLGVVRPALWINLQS